MSVVSVRFEEYEYYDIARDRDTLRLEAITNLGTFHADVDANAGVAALRRAFATYVYESLALGHAPHEVNIGGH